MNEILGIALTIFIGLCAFTLDIRKFVFYFFMITLIIVKITGDHR